MGRNYAWSRRSFAIALLIPLSGCGAKHLSKVDGVRTVQSQGSSVIVDVVVREPATAFDAPVALGSSIAALQSAIYRGVSDVPKDAKTLVLRTQLISVTRPHAALVDWMAVRISIPLLKQQRYHSMMQQRYLDLVGHITAASPEAIRASKVYCADVAHLKLSPAFCRMVSRVRTH